MQSIARVKSRSVINHLFFFKAKNINKTELFLNYQMILETHVGFWNIKDVLQNPKKLYVFADDIPGTTTQGEAIIRHLDNAIGVVTRIKSGSAACCDFCDADYYRWKMHIAMSIQNVRNKVAQGCGNNEIYTHLVISKRLHDLIQHGKTLLSTSENSTDETCTLEMASDKKETALSCTTIKRDKIAGYLASALDELFTDLCYNHN